MARRLPTHRPTGRMVRLSGRTLHWIGFFLLCLGSFSAAVLQRGILRLGDSGSMEALGETLKPGGQMMGWATGAVLCSLTASVAIPIYARLLYEAWRRGEDKKKLFLRLAVCAVASEIPYDLAMSGKVLEWGTQNPVWALLLAAIMLEILGHWSFVRPVTSVAFKAVVVIAALAWAVLLRVHMGGMLILLIALFHFAGKREALAALGGVAITILQFPAPFGLIFAHWYNGEKETGSNRMFYALYPVQLLVFALIARLVSG